MSDLLCCPFCGSAPVFPDVDDVYGTYYDAGCEDCGLATISLQIIDCFDYGESPNRSDVYSSWDSDKMRYGEEFIKTARENAVRQWNTRAGAAELSRYREAGEVLELAAEICESETFIDLAADLRELAKPQE